MLGQKNSILFVAMVVVAAPAGMMLALAGNGLSQSDIAYVATTFVLILTMSAIAFAIKRRVG